MKIVLLFLFVSSVAFANERGNGGDAVVCRDSSGKIVSIELLDYYEGRKLRRMNVVYDPGLTNAAYIQKLGAKLVEFDHVRFKDFTQEGLKLDKAIASFLATGRNSDQRVLFTDDVLTDIPDSDELTFQPGCHVEQLAIRVKKQFPEDPEYIIQQNLLKALSPRDVRGIIVHELIYRVVKNLTRGENSVFARYFHQKVMEGKVENFYFWNFVQLMGMPMIEYYSIPEGSSQFDLNSPKLLDGGYVLLPGSNFSVIFDRNGRFSPTMTRTAGLFRMEQALVGMGALSPGALGRFQIIVDGKLVKEIALPSKEFNRNSYHIPMGEVELRLIVLPQPTVSEFNVNLMLGGGSYHGSLSEKGIKTSSVEQVIVKKINVSVKSDITLQIETE